MSSVALASARDAAQSHSLTRLPSPPPDHRRGTALRLLQAAEMARQRAAQQVTHEHVRRLSAVHQAMSRTEREQRRRVRVARLTRREEQLRHEARAAERATVLLQRRAQHAADNARLQQQFQARAKEEEARRHAMQKRCVAMRGATEGRRGGGLWAVTDPDRPRRGAQSACGACAEHAVGERAPVCAEAGLPSRGGH